MKLKYKNEERKSIQEAFATIMMDFGVINEEIFENMDEEEGAILYENMKAGILEEYELDLEDLEELTEEYFRGK